MANREHYPVETSALNSFVLVPMYFVGNGTSNPTSFDIREITGVTRTGAGTFDVVLEHAYPTEVSAKAWVNGTAALGARVTAWDSEAKTLTVVTSAAGAAAGSAAAWTTGVTVMTNTATLGTAGRVSVVHATTQTGLFPAWTSGVAVTSHMVTLSDPGYVIAVEATTADSAGAKQIQFSGSPGAGFVQVAYDAAGIATLTFNATDNVSVAAVVFTRTGAGESAKKIISTGTPAPGEVTVTYAAGVATLTFAEDDAVTEASVLLDPVQTATSAAATDPSSAETVYIELQVRNSIYRR